MEFEFFGLKLLKTRDLHRGEKFFIVASFFYFIFSLIKILNSFGSFILFREESCKKELSSTLDRVDLTKECLVALSNSTKNLELIIEQAGNLVFAIAFYMLVVVLLRLFFWVAK